MAAAAGELQGIAVTGEPVATPPPVDRPVLVVVVEAEVSAQV